MMFIEVGYLSLTAGHAEIYVTLEIIILKSNITSQYSTLSMAELMLNLLPIFLKRSFFMEVGAVI